MNNSKFPLQASILGGAASVIMSKTPRGTSHYHTVKQVKESLNCFVCCRLKGGSVVSLEKKRLSKADELKLKQPHQKKSTHESVNNEGLLLQ